MSGRLLLVSLGPSQRAELYMDSGRTPQPIYIGYLGYYGVNRSDTERQSINSVIQGSQTLPKVDTKEPLFTHPISQDVSAFRPPPPIFCCLHRLLHLVGSPSIPSGSLHRWSQPSVVIRLPLQAPNLLRIRPSRYRRIPCT